MTSEFTPKSDFLRILTERGFVHQCSDYEGLDQKALNGELVAYIGFDCTAASLHVGSLLPIMMLHWLQQSGGKVIAQIVAVDPAPVGCQRARLLGFAAFF